MTAAFWQLNFLRQVCPPFHKLNPTSFTPMLFELCHSFYYPSSTNKTLRNSLKTKIAMLSLSSPFAHIMESSDNIAIKYINLHICVYIYSLIWVFINVQSHVAVWCPETHGWLLDRVYCLVLCDMPTSMPSGLERQQCPRICSEGLQNWAQTGLDARRARAGWKQLVCVTESRGQWGWIPGAVGKLQEFS